MLAGWQAEIGRESGGADGCHGEGLPGQRADVLPGGQDGADRRARGRARPNNSQTQLCRMGAEISNRNCPLSASLQLSNPLDTVSWLVTRRLLRLSFYMPIAELR